MKKRRCYPNFKAKFFAECFEIFNGAFTFVAEVKIFTHGHPTGMKSLNQNLFGELARSHVGQSLVEIQKENALNAAGGNVKDFVSQIVDAGKHFLAVREHFFGMRLECDGAGKQGTKLSCLNDLLKQGLMATVHTIEVADGHCTVIFA